MKKGLFMKLLLVAIVVQVIVFTWVYCYWSYKAGTEIAPVLSVAFLGFCGFEAGVCGYLKGVDKKKGDSENDEN